LKIAKNSGLTTIAEDVETRGELLLARDIGISLGKGALIARPSIKPARTVAREIRNILASSSNGIPLHEQNGIDAILEMEPAFLLENNNEAVFQVFEKNPQISLVAVSKE